MGRGAMIAMLVVMCGSAGCASTRLKEEEGEGLARVEEVSDYLSGMWRLEEPLAKLPWFVLSSSADANLAALNPPGLDPLPEGEVIEDLRITFFPGHRNPWGPEFFTTRGYVLCELSAGSPAVPRRYVRDYEIFFCEGEPARLVIDSGFYRLHPGNGIDQMTLVDEGDRTPVIRLRRKSRLPSHDTFGAEPPVRAVPATLAGRASG
jgi:hypothetical protein